MRCLARLVTIFVVTLHTSLALVNACATTTVRVEARGCDEKNSNVCCSEEGCVDRIVQVATYTDNVCWICGEDPLEKLEDGCWRKYTFGDYQLLAAIGIDFKEGAEDILKLYVGGTYHSTIKPEGEAYVIQDFDSTTRSSFTPKTTITTVICGSSSVRNVWVAPVCDINQVEFAVVGRL